MTSVISRHHSALGLPLGGPVLPPGVPTPVKRWNIIKGHSVVKAWLQAGVIEEIREEAATTPEAAPEPSPEPENDDEIASLRAEYQQKVGKRAYHAWDADTLKAKIAEAGDPADDAE